MCEDVHGRTMLPFGAQTKASIADPLMDQVDLPSSTWTMPCSSSTVARGSPSVIISEPTMDLQTLRNRTAVAHDEADILEFSSDEGGAMEDEPAVACVRSRRDNHTGILHLCLLICLACRMTSSAM